MNSTNSVNAVADQHVEDVAALDPVTATAAGIAGHDHELPDLSPAGFEARADLARRAVAAMTATQPADEREAVARDAFLERVGLEVENADAGHDRAELSVISSWAHAIRESFDLMSVETEEGRADVRARLAGVPAALEGYRTTLAEEAARGRVVARRQYAEVAGQIRRWTGQEGASGDFFTGLIPDAPEGRAASAAYADLGRWIETELAPRGLEKEAVGPERYALASREFLGAAVDLEETYAWGWQELKRLTDDMVATSNRIVPGGSIPDAVAALDADPARQLGSREEFRDWMQQLADRTISDLADVHFDIPEPIRGIECCLAPTNDGGVYYTGPSEDFTRPGRMWWSLPDDSDQLTTWREVTTVYHEGVPGHHLQVGQTVYRADMLNRWQRMLCWVSGHGEGWALYSERLMDELGYLEDPGDRLGMLDMQGFRAARVIVDIGLHLELTIPEDNPFGWRPGERWTPDLVFEFMRIHSRMDDAMLRFEVLRYLGWPGQAPSYKVGERIWLEARADAQARHGADFDLRAFHRAALDLGSIGLDPLRASLARL
ncbi:DUF885 domain-containing protein [Nocardioides hankookensis]|uniref:DUF885 domain-containing protein n=1 Tax=Nocardioides hankookensis TaxID=443157 RepID=A0ABW1LF51_9ACTN